MERITLEQLQEKIYQRWGEVEYEIIDFYSARTPITIKCLKCGEVFTLKYMSNLFNKARKNFCTSCAKTKKNFQSKDGLRQNKITFYDAQNRLQDNFGEEYEILKDSYTCWSKHCLIKHNNCGKIFSMVPRRLIDFNGHCPCYTINSKGEQKIKKFLDDNNIQYIQQKRLENIKRAPFDFYLPQYNLLIEFQGRQHFEPVKAFGGLKQFEIQKEIDSRKKEIALQQGFDLFYISYKEMSHIEEILVQRLSVTGVDSSESKSQSSQK